MAEGRDWDRDLAKIERQIGSMSDAELIEANARQRLKDATLPAASAGPAPGKGAHVPGKWGAYARVGAALLLGIGILFWPYGTRCGWPLVGYLAGTAAITLTGIWAGISTWRARLGAAHLLANLLVLWGLILGAREILPRVGYALPTEARPAIWFCDASGPNFPGKA